MGCERLYVQTITDTKNSLVIRTFFYPINNSHALKSLTEWHFCVMNPKASQPLNNHPLFRPSHANPKRSSLYPVVLSPHISSLSYQFSHSSTFSIVLQCPLPYVSSRFRADPDDTDLCFIRNASWVTPRQVAIIPHLYLTSQVVVVEKLLPAK